MRDLDKIEKNFRDVIAQIMTFKSNESIYVEGYRKKQKKNIEEIHKEKPTKEYKEYLDNVFNQTTETHIKNFPHLVSSMSMIYGVTHFEVFMTDIVLFLLSKYPESLKTKNKQLNYEEILSFNSISTLKAQLIQNEVERIIFGSIEDQLKYLKKKFKLKLEYAPLKDYKAEKRTIAYPELVEIYSARNLIIHNNTIVNKRYLDQNPESVYRKGQKLNLTKEYVTQSMFVLSSASYTICEAVKNKIK